MTSLKTSPASSIRIAAGLAARVSALALGAAVAAPRSTALEGCESAAPAHVRIISGDQLGTIDKGWWKARYTANWVPETEAGYLRLGPLQLFSQDVIAAGGAFAPHPHDNVEVLYLVLEGSFEHGDDAGNSGIAHAGDVMLMSAGKGVWHSERGSADRQTRVVTIWLDPRTRDVTPHHAVGTPAPGPGWRTVAADSNATLIADTDARVLVGRMEGGGGLNYTVAPGHMAYLASPEGAAKINGADVSGLTRAIASEGELHLSAETSAMVVLVDVPL